MPETFDYVIVGAGSAGCVLANRLSEDPQVRVALLEAGPPDDSFWIHLPIGYGKTMWDERVNWRFETAPDPGMNNRKLYWPRGKTLGGSSAINGLIAIRGQREDYDRWAENGCPGWSYAEVLPYFRKSERNPDFANDQYHGAHGPLSVSSIKAKHPLIEAAIGAAGALGVPRTRDFNGATQEGVGYYQLTTRDGWRASTAVAYLRPAQKRPNLKVFTRAQATRVVVAQGRATGVEARLLGRPTTFHASREVILSAGALQSPQLLMLSGIGPAAHLRAHGIAVIADRPQVGQNLQDHLQIRLLFRCTEKITTNDALATLWGRALMGLEWVLTRSGPLAVGINQGGLFTRVLPESTSPDIQFHIATLSADKAGATPHPFPGFTLSVCQLRPESRGEVRLASPDPLTAPHIVPNYLSTEADRRCAAAAVAFARKLSQTAPLARYVAAELKPGPAAATDDDFLAFARAEGQTIFHPSGTTRMGSDPDAVTDPRLRVNGVTGLRVVDCGVMPTLVSGNTNLPVVMMAEKAADMIREDARG